MHHLSKLLLELRDYFRDRVGVDVQNLCVVNVLPSNAGALLFIHHSVRYARAMIWVQNETHLLQITLI